ncbi:MAG: hypothetical protein WBB01_26505 [Phormidesmis sp.]
MLDTEKLVPTIGAAVCLVLTAASSSIAASFRYTTLTNQTTYTEGATAIAGSPYEGTFTNTIFNPFSGLAQTFSGFYQVQSGKLGEAVSLIAVQKRPTDRTGLGDDGTTRIEYLATPQSVATVPGAFTVPPGLAEFDFKFSPAVVASAPVVLSNGWVAESVPEPSTAFTLLGLLGLGLGTRLTR